MKERKKQNSKQGREEGTKAGGREEGREAGRSPEDEEGKAGRKRRREGKAPALFFAICRSTFSKLYRYAFAMVNFLCTVLPSAGLRWVLLMLQH